MKRHGSRRVCRLPRSAFPWFESYQAASASLYDQVWMTGWRFTSSMPAIMRSLSSCFEVTRMWRRTDRANLEKKPSMRLSHERTMLGREGKLEASGRSSGEPSSGFFRYMRGMIIEDQLDCSPGRVSSIEELEQFDELAAAMAISHERMDLAGKQINSCQQAERAMAFVLMIPRKSGVNTGFGRQIGRRGCDGLDSGLFIARDDRHRLAPLVRFGRSFFQDLDFTIDAQNLGAVRWRRRCRERMERARPRRA